MTGDQFEKHRDAILDKAVKSPDEWQLLIQAILLLAQVIQESKKE